MRDWFDVYFPWFFIFGFPVVCFIIAMIAGCSGVPHTPGPYCDTVDAQDWNPARYGDVMDVDPAWGTDTSLEAYLWEFAGGEGYWPSGNDFAEDGAAASPRAKYLNSLELLVTGFPFWESFDPSTPLDQLEGEPLKWFAAMVHQGTPATRFDCGTSGNASAKYWRVPRQPDTILYYPGWVAGENVWRTAVVVHENWHGTGAYHSVHDSSKDQSIERAGSYWMSALYLAALCHSSEDVDITAFERQRACFIGDAILRSKFVEPHPVRMSTLSDINSNFHNYLRGIYE